MLYAQSAAFRSRSCPDKGFVFQRKIGAGLTAEEFQKFVDGKNFGHSGLSESISMIAGALGWELEKITESYDSVSALQSSNSLNGYNFCLKLNFCLRTIFLYPVIN